jgi:hypothetical protein
VNSLNLDLLNTSVKLTTAATPLSQQKLLSDVVKPDVCKRFMLHMLMPEFIHKSGWNGYITREGAPVGAQMLKYVRDSGYFKEEYGKAFDCVFDIFDIDNDQSFYENIIIINSICDKIPSLIAGMVNTKDDCHVIESLENLLGKDTNLAQNAIKYFDEKIRKMAENKARMLYGNEVKCTIEDNKFKIEISKIHKKPLFGLANNCPDDLSNEIINGSIFCETCRMVTESVELKDRFMLRSGYSHQIGGHSTYAYIKKIGTDNWRIQEVNFGDGKPEPIINSSYRTLPHLVVVYT